MSVMHRRVSDGKRIDVRPAAPTAETFMQTENGIRAVAYEPKEAVKMRDDAR